MDSKTKCACPTCNCEVKPADRVIRNGKSYCSATCANECTQTTCLCVHDTCDCHDARNH